MLLKVAQGCNGFALRVLADLCHFSALEELNTKTFELLCQDV
jgi:hypothetical protein